ncbi:UDP-3-O-(3-hydroxymyristoyl)glucosamine N-acyltransferase [Thermodesulforhabdus norvegica]|uniref:UDP-3-O-acylglucosamine N-acyltransferase n=1 Tax=Thermodesulforhabdus norvegica TaxID=39841 RepID=A0A1I4UPT3_9BACT|nr:UDP-3-O-(3-hydroxymyristoyl)glucosamine N-acyltransferase [Thermodesulforhabdus norvegica]SFM90941.1 UDP-3-O-[3-hydroxymyristoyl] glucosamine N-acyltransferase [Thermodesulforhabdus norvegica]
MKGKSFSLRDIAEFTGSRIVGDPTVTITGVAAFDSARPGDITFVAQKKLLKAFSDCRASAVITSAELEPLVMKLGNFSLLVSDSPQLTFARVANLFFEFPMPEPGIHHSAIVAPSARVSPSAHLGPFVHVSEEAEIGERSVLMTGVYVGRNVTIGSGCVIFPRVVILDGCVIGNNVVIHAGTVIGSDGFGYVADEKGQHVKIPQVGSVVIEDDVEIGANCTVDRATFGATRIGKGTKIDNLVHIAHNVVIGQHCILAGQVGIAGSSRIGNHVIMAGQVGIADHVTIGDGVRIGAKSGVAANVPPRTDVVGIPAIQKDDLFRLYANIKRIERLKKDIERLKEFVKDFVSRQGSSKGGGDRKNDG